MEVNKLELDKVLDYWFNTRVFDDDYPADIVISMAELRFGRKFELVESVDLEFEDLVYCSDVIDSDGRTLADYLKEMVG
jgi:hypothetical protein